MAKKTNQRPTITAPIPCEICTKMFKEKKYLDAHMKSKHSEFLLSFNCAMCSKRFSSKYSFKYHCQNEHNQILEEGDFAGYCQEEANTEEGKK